MIKKENIKNIILDVEDYDKCGGSSYARFELNVDISNYESFGDFLWFGEKKYMEIEFDDLDRYKDFIEDGIEEYLSEGALKFIKHLKEELNY